MGLSMSKVSSDQPRADCYMASTEAKIESPQTSQEIKCWEKTYRERFTRKITVPGFTPPGSKIENWLTLDSLWGLFGKPVVLKMTLESVERQIHNNYGIRNCSPRYFGPTPQPLSAELRARTRQELFDTCDRWMESQIRVRVRHDWLRGRNLRNGVPIPVVISYLNHGDSVPPGLLDTCFLQVGLNILSKTTAVYFEPRFMRCWGGYCWDNSDDELDRCYGIGCAYIARAMLAAVREVHHQNGERANSQQFHWLANAFALEGQPGPRGATEAAIRTHMIICGELQNIQNKAVSSQDPFTWVEHGFEMGPIYRSVIILLDRQLELRQGEDEAEFWDILFERCSVLLVRTGYEDHLSAPIDLAALSDAGLTLPLDREEGELIDGLGKPRIVRVRLRTAVRFVMDLERREVNASPRLRARKNILDTDTLKEAEDWVDSVIAHAESHGSIDRDIYTWPAVRKARAHLDGDRCGLEFKSIKEFPHLRHW